MYVGGWWRGGKIYNYLLNIFFSLFSSINVVNLKYKNLRGLKETVLIILLIIYVNFRIFHFWNSIALEAKGRLEEKS